MIDKKVITSIFAAIGASLCCITPVSAVLAGSTGMASSFSWMEPFRPFGGQKEKVVIVDRSNVLEKTINIEGMTCAACKATVTKVGGKVDGVINISASTADKNAIVEYDKRKTNIESIMKAIGTTGYKPVSYDDEAGNHKVNDIKVKAHKIEAPKEEKGTAKCGGGKCGSK